MLDAGRIEVVEHLWLPIGGKVDSRRICGGIALQEKTVLAIDIYRAMMLASIIRNGKGP